MFKVWHLQVGISQQPEWCCPLSKPDKADILIGPRVIASAGVCTRQAASTQTSKEQNCSSTQIWRRHDWAKERGNIIYRVFLNSHMTLCRAHTVPSQQSLTHVASIAIGGLAGWRLPDWTRLAYFEVPYQLFWVAKPDYVRMCESLREMMWICGFGSYLLLAGTDKALSVPWQG